MCQNKLSDWSSPLEPEPVQVALCPLVPPGRGRSFLFLLSSGSLKTLSRNWFSCVWFVLLRVNHLIGFMRRDLLCRCCYVGMFVLLLSSPQNLRGRFKELFPALKSSSLLLKIICLYGTNSEFQANFSSCLSGEVTVSNEEKRLNPRKRTKWNKDRQFTQEKIQGSDYKDDQRAWEKNGCSEWYVWCF